MNAWMDLVLQYCQLELAAEQSVSKEESNDSLFMRPLQKFN